MSKAFSMLLLACIVGTVLAKPAPDPEPKAETGSDDAEDPQITFRLCWVQNAVGGEAVSITYSTRQ